MHAKSMLYALLANRTQVTVELLSLVVVPLSWMCCG